MATDLKTDLLLVGDGSLARVMADLIQDEEAFSLKGFLGRQEGRLHDLPVLPVAQYEAVSDETRLALAMLRPTYREQNVADLGPERFMTLRLGRVSSHATVGHGAVILPDSYVMSGSILGDFTHVHIFSIVGHDSEIGRYSFLGPNCILGGHTRIGRRCRIGMGAKIMPNITIGDDVTVGAGAVVASDIESGLSVLGNPARPIGKTDFDKF